MLPVMSNETDSNSERALWELIALHNSIMESAALNDRVYKAAETALGRIACEYYPGLKNWEPEQLRKLADRISRHAYAFTEDLAALSAAAERRD